MPRLKITLVLLAAVLTLSAIGSASASASCTANEWCVGGNTLLSGETAELAELATVTENPVLEAPSVSVKIECTALSSTKLLLDGTNIGSAHSLTFSGCKNVSAPKCELEGTTIATKPIEVRLVTVVGTEEVTTKSEPEFAPDFALIKLKGRTCSIAGTQPVKGVVTLTLPKGQVAATEQEIVANTGGSELDIGSSEAKLKGKARLKLKSGSTWNFG
jgi:hypothetical protein